MSSLQHDSVGGSPEQIGAAGGAERHVRPVRRDHLDRLDSAAWMRLRLHAQAPGRLPGAHQTRWTQTPGQGHHGAFSQIRFDSKAIRLNWTEIDSIGFNKNVLCTARMGSGQRSQSQGVEGLLGGGARSLVHSLEQAVDSDGLDCSRGRGILRRGNATCMGQT